MATIIILTVFSLNLLWAVLNWKQEYDLIKAVYSNPQGLSILLLVTAPIYLLGDIFITGAATSIFGFSGFQGSAMAILMSNLLSVFFFTPKGQAKQLVIYYRQSMKVGKNVDTYA